MSRNFLRRFASAVRLLDKRSVVSVVSDVTAPQRVLGYGASLPRHLTTTTTPAAPSPPSYQQQQPGIKLALIRKDGTLETTFTEDGTTTSSFPHSWLRDNCQCRDCFDHHAQCRKLTLEDWHHEDTPVAVQVVEGGGQVEVEWASGHRSRFEAEWLRQHSFTHSARDAQRRFLALEKELWSGEVELPRMEYGGVMRGDGREMLQFLITLERKGVVVLAGVPSDHHQAVVSIADSIGYVKPTHYGITYPIRSKASASSLAYTDQRLGMHNDLPYFQYVPGIIFLHCITQFEGEGGENDLCDGFQVADYLRRNHPQEYRTLTDTPVYFWDKGVAQVKQETQEYHKILNTPVIVLDRLSGAVTRINNSQLRDSFLDLPPEEVNSWYAALRLFNLTIDQHSVRTKLRSGEMLVMDNTRLLHGRMAYDSARGERHMNQAYLDWDAALSRRRVLQGRFGVVSEQ